MRPVGYVMLCVRIQNGVLKFEFECSILVIYRIILQPVPRAPEPRGQRGKLPLLPSGAGAARGQHEGSTGAARGQHGGSTVAARWQHGGSTVAARWQQSALFKKLISDQY